MIVFPEGNTLNNPTMAALLTSLKTAGIAYDLLTHVNHPSSADEAQGSKLRINRAWSRLLERLIDLPAPQWLIAGATRKLLLPALRPPYDLVLGVDRVGLVEAWIIAKRLGVPYALVSFEITFASETSWKFKHLERLASRDLAFAVVQDRTRGILLSSENEIPPEKLIYVPVGARGFAPKSSSRLRDDLGLKQEDTALIAMGSVSKWTMIDELARQAHAWPAHLKLIIHDRYGDTDTKLSKLGVELKSENVLVSNHPAASLDDLDYILSGMNFGVALYDPTGASATLGDNIRHIGLASGKIASYLRHGVPIVVQPTHPWDKVVADESLGVLVSDPSQIADAVSGAAPHPENCKAFFERVIDFANYEEGLLDAIRRASDTSGLLSEKL